MTWISIKNNLLFYWKQIAYVGNTVALAIASLSGEKAFSLIWTFDLAGWHYSVPWMIDIIMLLTFTNLIFNREWFTDHKENAMLNQKVDDLTSQIGNQNALYRKKLEENLQNVANFILELRVEDRITIYRPHQKNVTKLARFSQNVALITDGRTYYPRDEGFIAKALGTSNRYVIKQNLPDPNAGIDAYVRSIQEACDIPESVIKSINVKSRAYAVFALEDETTQQAEAIVVIESTLKKFDDVNILKTKMNGPAKKFLLHFVKAYKNFEPDTNIAFSKGF